MIDEQDPSMMDRKTAKNLRKLRSMHAMFKIITTDISFLKEYLGLKQTKIEIKQIEQEEKQKIESGNALRQQAQKKMKMKDALYKGIRNKFQLQPSSINLQQTAASQVKDEEAGDAEKQKHEAYKKKVEMLVASMKQKKAEREAREALVE